MNMVLCRKSPQMEIEYNLCLSYNNSIFAWILNKTEDVINIVTINGKTHGKIGELGQLCKYSVGNFTK